MGYILKINIKSVDEIENLSETEYRKYCEIVRDALLDLRDEMDYLNEHN